MIVKQSLSLRCAEPAPFAQGGLYLTYAFPVQGEVARPSRNGGIVFQTLSLLCAKGGGAA